MNNTTNNTVNTSKTKFPYVNVNIIYVLVVIAIAVLLTVLYIYVIKVKYGDSIMQYTQNMLLERSTAKEEHLILAKRTPVSLYANEYNLSMWVKVLDYDYNLGQPKYILRKGELGVFLHPSRPNLHVKFTKGGDTMPSTDNLECNDPAGCVFKPEETTTTQPVETTTTTAEGFEDITTDELTDEMKCIADSNICNNKVSYKHNEILDKVLSQYKDSSRELLVENFETTTTNQPTTTNHPTTTKPASDECILFDLPLQKWCHISINIDANNIDIYLDGKLVSSCNLEINPDVNLSNMKITPNGGYDGEIAKVLYTNVRLSNKQIYKLYKAGPL
jgi:hypothetical protein